MIKTLPLLENGKYGSPQLMISEKPSEECLDKIRELYRVRFFQNDETEDEYKYLMTIETLRFSFEEGSHWNGYGGEMPLSKEVTGNQWDFDGYFYVTDATNSYERIVIVPFRNSDGFDSSHNVSRHEALMIIKSIVKQLNEGTLVE